MILRCLGLKANREQPEALVRRILTPTTLSTVHSRPRPPSAARAQEPARTLLDAAKAVLAKWKRVQVKKEWKRLLEPSISIPDEACVMQLASLWSIDPTTLDHQFKEPATGLLGNVQWAAKRVS